MCIVLAVMISLGLIACGTEKQETPEKDGFKPSMDTSSAFHINIAGGYSNFEALEAEFDRFNEYYPDVELVFTKIDDYNNMRVWCARYRASW